MNQEDFDKLTVEQKQSLTDSRAAAAAAKQQVEDLERQLHHREERETIRTLVKESGPWAGSGKASAEEAAVKLASKQLKLDNGGLQVTDPDGSPLMGAHGLMTPAEFIAKFRQDHAYLTKQQVSAPTARENGVSDERLKTLFGAQSIGKEAQKLATENIAEYRRLRTVARERGILQ